jgi:hypothetical protein
MKETRKVVVPLTATDKGFRHKKAVHPEHIETNFLKAN